jgi:hypothetical protein
VRMRIWSHGESWDWCHICGSRGEHNADVFYPDNAEIKKERVEPGHEKHSKYIRICLLCAARIVAACDPQRAQDTEAMHQLTEQAEESDE